MIQVGGGPAVVDQAQVIDGRIEIVLFQPQLMIDKRTVAAQFLDKDAIAKALRGQQILVRHGKPDVEEGWIGFHAGGSGGHGHRHLL